MYTTCNKLTFFLQALHSLGLRKFVLGGIGPLGCIPNQLATGVAPPGKCVAKANDMAALFNKGLESLVDDLNSKYSNGSIFAYGNTYGAFVDILNNAKTHGRNYSNLLSFALASSFYDLS